MARAMGRYELLRRLARGGMAEVYLARRRAGGVEKLLVVKRIRAERVGDARFLELFVREARLSMSLAHQNIVPVFDFGRSGDQVFLAMERVEGRDLGSTLARPGVEPLPPIVAAFIAAECCRALAYAHQRRRDGEHLGVVHRDVTPRNVLLSWSGEVKLTDFGIAALAGEATTRLVGTPAYMAPEQARGEPVDARADIYAIGLVLREAMTGVRARPGADRDALVEAARRGELAPWPSGRPRSSEPAAAGEPGPRWSEPAAAGERDPTALIEIIDRATAPAPSDRYPDARSLLVALDGFIVAERAAAPQEAPDRRLADWLARAWGGARDDEPDDDAVEHADVVSMIDDGDLLGTGTERSLAATADDDGIPRPADPAPAAPRPVDPKLGASPPAAISGPGARRRTALAIAVVAGAIGAIVVFTISRRDHEAARSNEHAVIANAPPDAPVPATTDATSMNDTTRDATVIDPPPNVDAAIVVVITSDAAGPVLSDADLGTTGPVPPRSPRDATLVRSLDASPPRVTRKVRVNARPWATFTVDGGSTLYETISTVELAPGPHRLHFSNPQLGVERDVTIEVPADRDLDHVEDLRR